MNLGYLLYQKSSQDCGKSLEVSQEWDPTEQAGNNLIISRYNNNGYNLLNRIANTKSKYIIVK